VPEAAVEQPRAERFEISPTGPMPGPKMLATTGRPGEMEQAAMAAFHVSPGTFASERGFPGERRPLRVPLVGGQLASGIDEFGPHITAAFTLPPGSYATSVLRELMKTDDMDASPEHRDTPPVEGLAQRPGTPDGKV
jgi:tRNA pseudouridine13 synthase